MIKRNTTISKHVIEILTQNHQPLCVPQLMKLLKKQKINPNKTTIYRLMEKLVLDGSVSLITAKNGTSYYEHSNHHHHHFFCDSCDKIFCLPACSLNVNNIDISSYLPNNKFLIKNHDFNIYGTCEPCLAKQISE